MKRWIIIVLAGWIVGSWAWPAFAVDLRFHGDFRVRGFYTNNLIDQSDSANDSTAYNSMRFQLSALASAGMAAGVVTIDFTSTSDTGNQRFGELPSYGPQDRTFALIEAYLKADLRMMILSAGRRMFKIGHGIIFDDPADGIFMDVPLGPAKLTLVNLKPFDCSSLVGSKNPAIGAACPAGGGTGNDTDLYFSNLSLRPSANVATNVFVGSYQDRGPNLAPPVTLWPTGTSSVELWILGMTLDGQAGPIHFTNEVDYLWGQLEGTSGTDLEGLNLQLGGALSAGPAAVGLTLLYASGQNPSNPADVNINGLDGNLPTGLILTNGGPFSFSTKDGTCLSVNGESLGGIPNCVKGSGLKAIKGTGSMNPTERLNLQADVIYARASGSRFAGGSTHIGWEVDALAKYQLDDNLNLMIGLGYLIAGNFWKTSPTSPDPDKMIVIMAEINYFF